MTDAISDEFDRALARLCADTRLRAIEGGADDGAEADALWAEVDALGFTDALVGVEQGGVGLTLDDACSLLIAAGHAGLNHPFGETMVARALLAQAGWRPDGSCIAMARATLSESGELACTEVPGAALAGHVLAEACDEWLLLPVDAAASTAGAFRPHASASLRWTGASLAVTRFPRHGTSAETICNAVHAAAMAGALARVLALSVAYAGDRRQFGKAIGQFQAVQQQLAVLTEDACSAAVAARMGCSAAMLPDPLHAATAKLARLQGRRAQGLHCPRGAWRHRHHRRTRTGPIYQPAARMAHDAGHRGRCAQQLGEALLADNGLSFADFTRTRLTPTLPMVAR
jgi:acetyl-CoA C-acetyltransferase